MDAERRQLQDTGHAPPRDMDSETEANNEAEFFRIHANNKKDKGGIVKKGLILGFVLMGCTHQGPLNFVAQDFDILRTGDEVGTTTTFEQKLEGKHGLHLGKGS